MEEAMHMPRGPELTEAQEAALVRGLADQFKALNVMWVVLTILQVVSCAGIVAAAWNAYVLSRRWKFPEHILARSPGVVQAYRGDEAWFVSFFMINLLLGGVVGAFLIAWEFFFIRGKILKNAHAFRGLPESAHESLPPNRLLQGGA
jgi:hypothetical protein